MLGRPHRISAIDIEDPKSSRLCQRRGAGNLKDDSTGCGGYSQAIVVDHQGITSLFAHLAEFTSTSPTAWVDPDMPIGTMGHTGRVSGCSYTHLHYEESTTGTYDDGAVDPGPFLACVDGERRTYPEAWGSTSWSGLPGHQVTAVSEGSNC